VHIKGKKKPKKKKKSDGRGKSNGGVTKEKALEK